MEDITNKRSFDNMEAQEPKRMKPEEIIGSHDDKKATTRLFMGRQEFSKVIGKGGATITHIRNTCGANVKGFELDAENRVMIFTGTLRQVLEAFEMISELMYQSYVQNPQSEQFVVQLLLENSKAGRVVGAKGAMIQQLKLKSGAVQIRMQKDPTELSGVALRFLTVEGALPAVRRAHYYLQELFVDPSQIALLANPGGAFPQPGYEQQHAYAMQQGAGGGGGGFAMQAGGPVVGAPLPLPSLTSLGVQAETVRQLSEMKVYLSRQFGLDLWISKEVPPGAQVPQVFGPPQGIGPFGPASPGQRAHNPEEITFMIPRASAGGIIGKGGQGLKELQAAYGVRIYIEKDELPGGMRLVALKPMRREGEAGQQQPGAVGLTPAEREAMVRCQERVVAMSQDPAIAGPGGTAN